MLIEYPHDLCSVHCGAAAESDDGIGLKGSHLLGALDRAGEGGIGLNIRERGVLNSQLIELIGDGLCISVLIKEAVGHKEHALLVHNIFQFVKGNRHTALLDINLFGRSEPKHIFSPFGNRFDID